MARVRRAFGDPAALFALAVPLVVVVFVAISAGLRVVRQVGHGTYFVSGAIHFLIYGVVVFGFFAIAYRVVHVVVGAPLDRTAGLAHFWLTLVTFVVTFAPLVVIAIVGPERFMRWALAAGPGQAAGDLVVDGASKLLLAAQMLFVAGVVLAIRRARRDASP